MKIIMLILHFLALATAFGFLISSSLPDHLMKAIWFLGLALLFKLNAMEKDDERN